MKVTALVGVVVLLTAAALGGLAFLRRGAAEEGPCAVTLAPGADIAKAVQDAGPGATVCLAAGRHRGFAASFVRAGVTLKGESADTTIVERRAGTTITLADSERFTLADLTVSGGSPAGISATRTRALTLRGVRIEAATTGLSAEGAGLTLENVTVSGSTDFGLLLRRGTSLTGQGVHIAPSSGRGIGALDNPGPLTLRDSEVTSAQRERAADGMILNGRERFALTNVTVRGGNPSAIYAVKARDLVLRGVHLEGAVFGLHLDDNASGDLEDVTIAGSTGVGLLLQRGGTVNGRALHILDTNGTGVSAINGPGLLSLRDSEISRVAAAGLFAGVAGCEDLPPASLRVPDCFLQDPQSQISTARVQLERITMRETGGPCLVFFPGVHAEVRDSTLTRCELTGLFAWGAQADVSGTTFEDNAEHALEYRAFPDPRGPVLLAASGTIQDSVIRATRPLEGDILGDAGPGPVLGGGIVAQGAKLVLLRNEVSGNRDIGVSFVNGSSGEVTENRILANGNVGLCILPGTTVAPRDNTLAGNRSDDPNACGGLATSAR